MPGLGLYTTLNTTCECMFAPDIKVDAPTLSLAIGKYLDSDKLRTTCEKRKGNFTMSQVKKDNSFRDCVWRFVSLWAGTKEFHTVIEEITCMLSTTETVYNFNIC